VKMVPATLLGHTFETPKHVPFSVRFLRTELRELLELLGRSLPILHVYIQTNRQRDGQTTRRTDRKKERKKEREREREREKKKIIAVIKGSIGGVCVCVCVCVCV
jgi:hypothetical protein